MQKCLFIVYQILKMFTDMLQKLVWRRNPSRMCTVLFTEKVIKSCANTSLPFGRLLQRILIFAENFLIFCHSFCKQYYRHIRMDFWKGFAALWQWGTWGQQLGIKAHTAKNQYWKFETNIPRKGIARPQSRFPHLCVCERLLYSYHRSAYSAAGNMWTDPGNI